MCVAWYPVYRIPDAPLNAKFLTYHSLAPTRTAATHYGALCPSSGAVAALPGSAGGSGAPNGGSPHAPPLPPQHPQQHAQQLCLPLVGLKLIGAPGETWLDPVPGFTPLVSHARCGSGSSSSSSGCNAEEAVSPLAPEQQQPPGSWEGGAARRQRLAELSCAADRLSAREALVPAAGGVPSAGAAKHAELSGHQGRHDDYTWFLKHEASPLKM
jgi:hypothetical protein